MPLLWRLATTAEAPVRAVGGLAGVVKVVAVLGAVPAHLAGAVKAVAVLETAPAALAGGLPVRQRSATRVTRNA
ncbi:MAG TPA: hypothetical protein VED59_06060 [Acidimicrobiales bacterium]|nr:hypothetical protein [Acidimicrobiales bacterium]